MNYLDLFSWLANGVALTEGVARVLRSVLPTDLENRLTEVLKDWSSALPDRYQLDPGALLPAPVEPLAKSQRPCRFRLAKELAARRAPDPEAWHDALLEQWREVGAAEHPEDLDLFFREDESVVSPLLYQLAEQLRTAYMRDADFFRLTVDASVRAIRKDVRTLVTLADEGRAPGRAMQPAEEESARAGTGRSDPCADSTTPTEETLRVEGTTVRTAAICIERANGVRHRLVVPADMVVGLLLPRICRQMGITLHSSADECVEYWLEDATSGERLPRDKSLAELGYCEARSADIDRRRARPRETAVAGQLPRRKKERRFRVGFGGKKACFVSGTIVLGPSSRPVPIERVQAGDQILSWDQVSSQPGLATVVDVIRESSDSIVLLRFASGELAASPSQTALTTVGWKSFSEVAPGDSLIGWDQHTENRVNAVRTALTAVPVWSLLLDRGHTHAANGVIVEDLIGVDPRDRQSSPRDPYAGRHVAERTAELSRCARTGP